jgi:hypothetical protein
MQTFEQEFNRILAKFDAENGKEDSKPLPEEEPEEFDVYVEPDRITVIKRPDPQPQTQIIESAPVTIQKTSLFPAYAVCLFYLFLIICTLLFQVYALLNPPIATITIIPKTKTVTFSGTLQLGRLLHPITIKESQTVSTTGKGHQDARSAIGYITFYNGEFQSVTIPAGKALTGSSGVTVITDQDAVIPAANLDPPTFGQVKVSAHAVNPGQSGNIAAYDINSPCCFASVISKNPENFTGGLDERNYQTVAKSDIDTTASPLKIAVEQSMQGALQGQVKPPEQLQILPCSSTISPDHKAGDDAKKVTVSETCSAIAYNRDALERKAADLLTRQAVQNLGTGYSLVGEIQITMKRATITHTPPLVFSSFHAQETWIYALSQTAQQHIKVLIAGKSKQQALNMLSLLPGIERAAISWGDSRLPKDTGYIHIRLFVV